jgi:hypothetical protein
MFTFSSTLTTAALETLGKRLGITAYRHAPIRSLLWQRPLLDARAQTIDVTYLIY